MQIIATMLVRALYDPWKRSSKDYWEELIEFGKSNPDKDFRFDDVLREALIRFFGYYGNDSGQRNKFGGSRVMLPGLAQFIFDSVGWNEREPRNEKEATELNWLREELDVNICETEKRKVYWRHFSTILGVVVVIMAFFFYILGLFKF